MELHILEHRLRVASIAKESIQLFTYGLIKLAFLSSKTRWVPGTPPFCPPQKGTGFGGAPSSPPRGEGCRSLGAPCSGGTPRPSCTPGCCCQGWGHLGVLRFLGGAPWGAAFWGGTLLARSRGAGPGGHLAP